jgi:hypothetical protein
MARPSTKQCFIERLKLNTAISKSDYERIVELLNWLQRRVLSKEDWEDFILTEYKDYYDYWFGLRNILYRIRLEYLENLRLSYIESYPELEKKKNKKKDNI